MGTAPFFMTSCVCSDVPDAIFVNAQAASSCLEDVRSKVREVWPNVLAAYHKANLRISQILAQPRCR